MKLYKNYIIIIVVLAAVAIYLFWNNSKSTLKIESNHFAITDTSDVFEVKIISRKDTLKLEQVGENWMVNSNYNARTRLVKAILGLMQSITVKAPVPAELEEQLQKQFDINSTTVSFDFRNRKKLEFQIIEPDSLNIGTVIREAGSSKMYTIEIQGFNSKLSLLFNTRKEIWAENILIRLKPWEILSINMEYPQEHSHSFQIELSNPEEMTITKNYEKKAILLKKEQIAPYLYSFGNVPYEPVSDTMEIKKQVQPFAILTIKNSNQIENKISFYTKISDKNSNQPDMFKAYAFIGNNSRPVLVKYTDIDPITQTFDDLTKH